MAFLFQTSGLQAQDADGDGFELLDDCNDNDPTIYPGAIEIPNDSIDQDCDGRNCTSIHDYTQIRQNIDGEVLYDQSGYSVSLSNEVNPPLYQNTVRLILLHIFF